MSTRRPKKAVILSLSKDLQHPSASPAPAPERNCCAPKEITFEIVPEPTMKWHCIDCHQNFQGPTDRSPASGCAHCGSHNCFDVNIEPVHFAPESDPFRGMRFIPIRKS